MIARRTPISSEAHLPAFRPIVLVKLVGRPRRSAWGWALFIALILANEARGAYVALNVWQALFG